MIVIPLRSGNKTVTRKLSKGVFVPFIIA